MIHILTAAFANPDVFRASMKSLRDTVDFDALGGGHHLVLNNHYPLRREECNVAIEEYSSQNSHVVVHDAGKNLGLHDGLSYLLNTLLLADDDIVIGFDSDEDPQRKGWANAMQRVFAADPTVGWLSLTMKYINEALDQGSVPNERIGGEWVRFPPSPLMNVVVGWRGATIKAMGGKLVEPHRWYGGLESMMQPMCREAGYRVGFLADWPTLNHRALSDPIYETYKHHHVGVAQPIFPGSFEDFLKEQQP